MADAALEYSAILGLRDCAKASRFTSDALEVFQKACETGDWAKAEEARIVVVGSTEAYLDAFMSAHKAMRTAR